MVRCFIFCPLLLPSHNLISHEKQARHILRLPPPRMGDELPPLLHNVPSAVHPSLLPLALLRCAPVVRRLRRRHHTPSSPRPYIDRRPARNLCHPSLVLYRAAHVRWNLVEGTVRALEVVEGVELRLVGTSNLTGCIRYLLLTPYTLGDFSGIPYGSGAMSYGGRRRPGPGSA